MTSRINLDICIPVLFQVETYHNVPYFLLVELMPYMCIVLYCTKHLPPIIVLDPHRHAVALKIIILVHKRES